MKNIFTKALLIASMTLFSVLPMAAQALGTSCENPFVITEEFSVNITEPGSYWFSATTYDLPLRVRYTPDVATDEDMVAYVDFSCTPGVYDDPNLYELTDLATGWGIDLPMVFTAQDVIVDGNIVHEIMVSETYRGMMSQFGILYNVSAVVNVQIPQPGAVAVIPDTVFRQTVENSHWIELPDTINVGLSTIDSMYVLPITDWIGDSVRIEWLGKETPASVWIASAIDFPLDLNHSQVMACIELDPVGGNNYFDLSAEYLNSLLQEISGGMFFAKIITAEDAQIVFDYKPMSPEMASAIRMELDEASTVAANDVEQYYYFDKEWADKSLVFTAEKADSLVAYFGTTPTFTLDASDDNYLGSYTFYPEQGKATLYLSSKELEDMASECEKEFIFVRFASKSDNSIVPSVWASSDCASNSVEIFPTGTVRISGNSSGDIYRIDYNKWSKGDVQLNWDGRTNNKSYFADTCAFTLSSTNSHVLQYKLLKKGEPFTLTYDYLQSIADRVDADGYLYYRFDTRGAGELQTVFTLDSTSIPVEPDLPAVPTTDCSLSSLPLAQGDQVTLNLDSAFTVYRIDYKAWLKSGANLTWNGAEPLHTFVAETCAFALAPYNRYVLAYIPVPAQGNIVLDAIQLAAMEEYVSEDGFLYIRFLTKEEGVLTVE